MKKDQPIKKQNIEEPDFIIVGDVVYEIIKKVLKEKKKKKKKENPRTK